MGVVVCSGQAPPNDAFTNAIPLYGNLVTFGGALSNATYEPGESPCTGSACFDPVHGSLWWQWTATNSTLVVIHALSVVDGPNHSEGGLTGFSVHEATNAAQITAGSELDWSRLYYYFGEPNYPRPSEYYLVFNAIQGKTYHIRAFGTPRADFKLRLTAATAPVILRPPESQTLPASLSAVFSVMAGGLQPMSYQWQFEGTPLPGQTRPILHLRNLAANQTGNYSVVVSNATGVSTSAVAQLTISPVDAGVKFAVLPGPDPSRFYFSLTGREDLYHVESTTNLVQWTAEESLESSCSRDYGRMYLESGSCTGSIPRITARKFLRARLPQEYWVCIANLQAVASANTHWAIHGKHALTDPVTLSELQPYLIGDEKCPFGGTTLDDSYTVSDPATAPVCQWVPSTHVTGVRP